MNYNLESSLNDFQILQEIGKGAFGCVFKVKRIRDGEIYALKKVPIEKLKPKEKENSLNEIRILASINHPNVISYKEAFFDYNSHNLCIVMEFADDGDLENKINYHIKNKKQIEEKEIVKYFTQIVQGLKALHDKKIIHRDIKAANIFLFISNLVKIGDLNVSKVFKTGVNFTQTGTPYYASPEVWCDKSYDYKADIWSLGCLLYEMCALKPPFRGNSMKAVFEKVMKGVYEPIPAFYSKQLGNILKMALQKNPENRPTCDQILRIILDNKLVNPLYPSNDKNIMGFRNFNTEGNNNNIYEGDEDNKIPLLDTIKIPKKIFQLNMMMPKSNYKKRNHSLNSIDKKDESCLIQSKIKFEKSYIPNNFKNNNNSLIDRNSLDVSEFYQKQFKLIDEILKESPKNLVKEKFNENKIENNNIISNLEKNSKFDKPISTHQEKSQQNDPILNIIHKPILIKNKILHNLKSLQKEQRLEKKDIINNEINNQIPLNIVNDKFKNENSNNPNLDKSEIKQRDVLLLNLVSKIPIKIGPSTNSNSKSRCISANNSNHVRNNSNNIRRILNQDISYIQNDNSFLHNASALPVIPNIRQYNSNKIEKPIKIKIPAEIPKSQMIDRNINNHYHPKCYSDKNVFEIKNLNANLIDKINNLNYHYHNPDSNNKIRLNYINFNRLMEDRKKIIDQRPFSHLNVKKINLDNKYQDKKLGRGVI